MTVVISDTSPIRALANLGLLGLLPPLFGKILIPQAVALELSQPPKGQRGMSLDELEAIAGVEVATVTDWTLTERFEAELDRGESEALALAIELAADLILIDEAAGRAVARREGIPVIGVLGVLLEARHRGLIGALAPLLDQLQTSHQFFISEKLRQQILRSAGE